MTVKRCCNCKNFEAIEDQSFTDTQTGKIYYVEDFDEIINLLNNKDKRIKELEKDLNDALNRIEERSIDVQLLKEENGNLKKENELKGDFRNFINEDIVRIKKENEKLKNEIKMLKSTIARNEAYITRLTKKGKWTK